MHLACNELVASGIKKIAMKVAAKAIERTDPLANHGDFLSDHLGHEHLGRTT